MEVCIENWVPADDDVDMLIKGHINRDVNENERRLKDKQIAWIDRLAEQGRIEKKFNKTFGFLICLFLLTSILLSFILSL